MGSCVYFIRWQEWVKIGVTTDLHGRVRAIQQGLPCGNVSVLVWLEGCGRDTELQLHQRWRTQRKRGEWFSYKGELSEFIGDLSTCLSQEELVLCFARNGCAISDEVRSAQAVYHHMPKKRKRLPVDPSEADNRNVLKSAHPLWQQKQTP